MDCKLESAQAKIKERKNEEAKEESKENPQQEQICMTTTRKQKVGDCHSNNLIGSLIIAYTIQNPFEEWIFESN